MSQCQRCGATNEPASRFCVACGAPLVAQGSAQIAAMPSGQPRRPAAGSAAPADAGGFEYAPTAAPPTREEFEAFEAQRAAAQAAAAVMRGSGAPPAVAPMTAPPPDHGRPPSVAPDAPGTQRASVGIAGVAQDPEDVPDGAPRLLAGFIVSYDSQPLGRFWPLYQGRNRVGREGSGADLDAGLDHPTTSSRHAVILAAARPGRLKLEDIGSTNGTFLNGTRIAPGARHELRDGDQVRFGLLSSIIKIV